MASSSTGPASKILFSLDTPSAIPLNFRESYVRGWCVPDSVKACELWLIVDQVRIPVFTGLPRPDVLRHHNYNPVFANAGFLVRFQRSKAQALVTLVAATENGEIVLAASIPVPGFCDVYEPGTDAVYRDWIATVEPSLFWPEEELSKRLEALSYQPLISVLLNVPESHPYLVTRSVESVLVQRYGRWQLCVRSGQSGYFDKLVRTDDRVQWTRDRALQAASGEFVLHLDYRDELHPFALLEIVRALNAGGPVDLVYTDEDEIDFHGNRVRPFHKPDFDPEVFPAWNFIGHGMTVRRSVLPQPALDDEIDSWDAVLRILETPNASVPWHISKPLYHFRRGNPSLTPLPREEDRDVSPAPLIAHLSRTGTKASVEPGLFPGSFRLVRERGAEWQIAVFVRCEDGAFQHAALAATIDRRTTRVYELFGSGAQLLGAVSQPHVARSLEEIPADVFVFINRPLETLNHAFFDELVRQAMREDCGVVTGISLNRAGQLLSSINWPDALAGIPFTQHSVLRDIRVVRSVDAISSEFFAVKRSQLETLGGLASISSAHMAQLTQNLVEQAKSAHLRVLVTPFAVATFDIDSDLKRNAVEHSDFPESERDLAAAQLREVATERNQMRREMAGMQETITRLEGGSQTADLRRQVQELTAALETERRALAEIQDSRWWKIAHHLRACVRILRGKP